MYMFFLLRFLMSRTSIVFICIVLGMGVFSSATAWASTTKVGMVIAVSQGGTAQTAKKIRHLELKSPIYVGDVVKADATGGVQILFDDDSILVLAEDGEVTINRFVYSGTESSSPTSDNGLDIVVNNGSAMFSAGESCSRGKCSVASLTVVTGIGCMEGDKAEAESTGVLLGVMTDRVTNSSVVSVVSAASDMRVTVSGDTMATQTLAQGSSIRFDAGKAQVGALNASSLQQTMGSIQTASMPSSDVTDDQQLAETTKTVGIIGTVSATEFQSDKIAKSSKKYGVPSVDQTGITRGITLSPKGSTVMGDTRMQQGKPAVVTNSRLATTLK